MKKLSKKESLFFLMKAIEQYGYFLEQDRNFDTVKSYYKSEDLKALYDSKNTEEKGDSRGITYEANRYGKIDSILNAIEWATARITQWNKNFCSDEYLEILSAYNVDAGELNNRDKAELNHCVVVINDIMKIATGCDRIIVGQVDGCYLTIGLKDNGYEPKFDGDDKLNYYNNIKMYHFTEKNMFDTFNVSQNTSINFEPHTLVGGEVVDPLSDYVCFTKHIGDIVGDKKVMQGIYDVWKHYIDVKKDIVERMQARKNQFVQDKIKVFTKLVTDYITEHYGFTPELDI